ncbi:hypothetical protein [Soonwooa sp.]|uniref:hypothetical protein n=1 Tax=Soonwooa sp. TaxID=1938592 RepID=UPI002603648D|nr:hypothetical protein [Soonwooa sp.]
MYNIINNLEYFLGLFIFLGLISGAALFVMTIPFFDVSNNEEVMSKKFKFYKPMTVLFSISLASIFALNILIKNLALQEFKNIISTNQIANIDIEGFYLDNDSIKQFYNMDVNEAERDKCEHFPATITFTNTETIPIEIIRRCNAPNSYGVYLKQFTNDVYLGNIETDALSNIKGNN